MGHPVLSKTVKMSRCRGEIVLKSRLVLQLGSHICQSSKRITHDEGTRGLHPEFDKIIIVLLSSPPAFHIAASEAILSFLRFDFTLERFPKRGFGSPTTLLYVYLDEEKLFRHNGQ